MKRVLYPSLKKMYGGYGERTGRFDKITGDYIKVTEVEMVDQNPIGRSSRSNPATYVKAYDDIRSLFADQPLARTRAYKPGFFSFNIEGGRCEECEGEGVVQIGMQFMADIHLTCESCKGKRFKEEVLEVTYQGLNIADILDLTIDQAIEFFSKHAQSNSVENRIVSKLKPLAETGSATCVWGNRLTPSAAAKRNASSLPASWLKEPLTSLPCLFSTNLPPVFTSTISASCWHHSMHSSPKVTASSSLSTTST